MEKYNEYRGKFHDKFMSLKIPTVNTCCCFLDLRTAGLVIGIFVFISNIFFLFKGENLFWSVISLFTTICWLYGIHKDKPYFMFARLISDLIGLIQVFIIAIILDLIMNAEVEQDDAKKLVEANIVYTIVLVILVGPMVYFWIVCYSLYKSMLERLTDSAGSTGAAAAPSEGYAGV
ncbi:uncharacterized protein LOC129570295 [Sitodiplosis mosellana]|uniref:uncharacterized protein LOC129570295 n=1 Tax=Sitodiplosis mosellana TaxID=263140 RepID=UPI00244375C0|nr:uncharacterized protein LOC129570295 [Sitodiplosis mosellana]